MTKKIIVVQSCGQCPYLRHTRGYYEVWVCDCEGYKAPSDFRFSDTLEKDGEYPEGLSAQCPLQDFKEE
jgi:hypothetical protein